MAPPTSVLSKTLQSITLTKIRELEKQRAKYENRKSGILEETNSKSGRREIIAHLLAGVQELYPLADHDPEIENIGRWLDQSRYDASIPDSMLESFEKQLRTKLEVQSRKLGLADLYSRLLTEWMSPPGVVDEANSESEDVEMEGESFEMLERQKERLKELCDKFESVVFEPLETNEVEIDNYLQNLFSEDAGQKALKVLRRDIKFWGDSLWSKAAPFDEDTLVWCINGLLAEDLLSDEKQTILQDFLENKIVLAEIADVLNMRFADLENWNWEAGEDGIPVLPRQQLNGKYRIWMDEDVLQAIFVHYLGIKWCVALKKSLTEVIQSDSLWQWDTTPKLSKHEAAKRDYFLNNGKLWPREQQIACVTSTRKETYIEKFFLSQLPTAEDSITVGGSYNDESGNDDSSGKKHSSIKQQLLRQLATDFLLHQTLKGEAAVVQTDLQWYATALPHSTIFAIMRFVGFSEKWVSFFKKFLEAPLNMKPSSGNEDSGKGPRLRKRGVPMAHAPEKLIGELVLFVMDMVVNKEAGMLLFRLHDDLWICGEPARCAKAWSELQIFAKIAGLEFNRHKTGSVYLKTNGKKDNKIDSSFPKGAVCIGFLTLDPDTGTWVIDQKQVDAHVTQLQKQLDGCTSILSWIQTWNSCIGRFFGHTFGEPACCLGREHVDSILETHSRIQRTIFGCDSDGRTKTVSDHLKSMIHNRFGVSSIPDAFLYLPEQLGGLNVLNPFVPFFLVRNNLQESPKTRLTEFFAAEKILYAEKKKDFEDPDNSRQRVRNRREFYSARDLLEDDTDLGFFMTFEDFTAHRESESSALYHTYLDLTSTPYEQSIKRSPEMGNAMETWNQDMPALQDQSAEAAWAMQMHSRELFDKFGGLSMVDQVFLPLGVLTMIRKKKVTWQMVL